MTRFSLLMWLFVSLASLALLRGWFVDRSNLVRTIDHEREERQAAADMAFSATKAYREAESMIEQYRAEREKKIDAMNLANRLLPVMPEGDIAKLQAELSQSRATFLELGKLAASFGVFEFHRETREPTLVVEGGKVTDEVAAALIDSGIRYIAMSNVTLTAEAEKILLTRYEFFIEERFYHLELREKVRPPLAK